MQSGPRFRRAPNSKTPQHRAAVMPRAQPEGAPRSSSSCGRNWRVAAALSVVLAVISTGTMAWLGRGFFRALNSVNASAGGAAASVAPKVAASLSASASFKGLSASVAPSPSVIEAPAASFSVAPSSVASASASISSAPPPSATSAPPAPVGPYAANPMYARSQLVPTAFRVVRKLPHDVSSFTQGLMWRGEKLYEGTGMKGASRLSRVDVSGGRWAVEQQVPLSPSLFGEGIAVWTDSAHTWTRARDDGTPRDVVIQLTWQNRKAFIYDADDLRVLHEWTFSTLRNEGWGITHDGESFIVSDGSEYLFFWDPATLQETRRVRVLDQRGAPVRSLNELEFVHGWVLANVWQHTDIVVIDPATGAVASVLDCSSLVSQIGNYGHGADVLNGIAYKPPAAAAPGAPAPAPWSGRLWLTGKYWDSLFEVEVSATANAGGPAGGGGGGRSRRDRRAAAAVSAASAAAAAAAGAAVAD